MSLHKLQNALVEKILTEPARRKLSNQVSAYEINCDLDSDEEAWLNMLGDTTGFKVTCDIQQWWRSARLKIATPLTLRMLSRLKLDYLLEEYQACVPCTTLFFAAEAIAFKDFLLAHYPGEKQLVSVVEFECALKIAHEHQYFSSCDMQSSKKLNMDDLIIAPATEFVAFYSKPVDLLYALLANAPLPVIEDKEITLIVSPFITGYWTIIDYERMTKQ